MHRRDRQRTKRRLGKRHDWLGLSDAVMDSSLAPDCCAGADGSWAKSCTRERTLGRPSGRLANPHISIKKISAIESPRGVPRGWKMGRSPNDLNAVLQDLYGALAESMSLEQGLLRVGDSWCQVVRVCESLVGPSREPSGCCVLRLAAAPVVEPKAIWPA